METLKVDRTRLYTQSEYARKVKLTPARINQMINEGLLKTVKINGTVLIYVD